MGLYENRPSRLVIPRWRDFKDTSRSGELSKDRLKFSPSIPNISCKKQLDNWNKEKSIGNALELVNSAFVSGELNLAIEAANFILSNCNNEANPAIKVAKLILNNSILEQDSVFNHNTFDRLEEKIKLKIQDIRKRLNIYPKNAVLWIDYARWNTIIGKFSKAEKCIKIALTLASDNVFILRCAVRFFIHKSKYDVGDNDSVLYALRLIRKNEATKHDPWLMATEISLCTYLNKTSSLMKSGFSLIDAKKFSAFSLSELTSAIATVELYNDGRKTKKLFSQSLIDPNENSVAQAQWASNLIEGLSYNSYNFNSHEANSYHNRTLENWEGAFNEALNWLVDEPFSSSPANHASYLASAIVDNNEMSISICNFGLRSNPNDFSLLNNKAYSQAIENLVEQSEATFNQINTNKLTDAEKVTFLATNGLIYYRKGLIEKGNLLYDEAENLAKKQRDEATAFRVKVYKLRSQHICGCCNIDEKIVFEDLMKELDKFKKPELVKTMKNVKKRLGIFEKDDKIV
jgi:tetratricopeptide (TPR) repeat protein